MNQQDTRPLGATPDAAADLAVSAGRVFAAALRVARVSGIGRIHAVRAANDFTIRQLGIDWCQELGIAEEVAELAPHSEAPTITGLLSSNVGAFLEQLHAGALAPLHPAPGLTTEWYRAYCTWCKGASETPVSLKRFVIEATRNHRLRKEVKRFRVDDGYQSARVFLFGQHAPAHVVNSDWLAAKIADTRQMFAAAGVQLR